MLLMACSYLIMALWKYMILLYAACPYGCKQLKLIETSLMAPFLTKEYKLSKALDKVSYYMRLQFASLVSSIFPGPIAKRVVTALYTQGNLCQAERPRNLKVMYFQGSFICQM